MYAALGALGARPGGCCGTQVSRLSSLQDLAVEAVSLHALPPSRQYVANVAIHAIPSPQILDPSPALVAKADGFTPKDPNTLQLGQVREALAGSWGVVCVCGLGVLALCSFTRVCVLSILQLGQSSAPTDAWGCAYEIMAHRPSPRNNHGRHMSALQYTHPLLHRSVLPHQHQQLT